MVLAQYIYPRIKNQIEMLVFNVLK